MLSSQPYRFLILLTWFFVSSCKGQQTEFILNSEQFRQQILSQTGEVVLDVRTAKEFNKEHLEDAVNLDYNSDEFEEEVLKLDKQKTYFVYCLSGGRSGSAATYMRQNGFSRVYELDGGIMAWKKARMPVIGKETKDRISASAYSEMLRADKVLVDFYAPWCQPCRELKPVLDALETEYKGKVKLIRINIDENPQLARELGIEDIPVLRIYRQGQETWQHKGKIEKAGIEEALQLHP